MDQATSHGNGGFIRLVLTRKTQEAVVVGGSGGFEGMLKVTVLEISRGKVRLGFEADADVPVHRWEVWERIGGNGRPDNPTEDGSAAPTAG
jgi:carbon storage regulator CsrA